MKRLSIIVLLTMCLYSQAQVEVDSLPYNIGIPWFIQSHPFDSMHVTTHDGTECKPDFFFVLNRVEPSDVTSNMLFEYEEYATGGDLAFGFYFDSTIHLIGVATNFVYGITVNGVVSDTSNFDSVVVRTYTPIGNDMSLSAVASTGKQGIAGYKRVYLGHRGWASEDQWFDSGFVESLWERSVRIREIYFDNEIDVSDSLYISVKNKIINYNLWDDPTRGWMEVHTNPVDERIFPVQSYRVKHCEDCPWIYGEQHSYPFLFPIIRRDCDSCPQVRGLQFIKSSTRKAFFRWNNGVNHHDWQMSYGPAGTAPEDGTILEYDGRLSGLIEFDPDSHYVVYVRARCRFARDEYGPWSEPLNFCLNGNGIDEVDAAGLTLTPNPTSGKVAVGCSIGIQQVTVFNTAGVQVHTESIGSGTSATIDTKGWPAGQYVVTVETAAGTASKVLTVAR